MSLEDELAVLDLRYADLLKRKEEHMDNMVRKTLYACIKLGSFQLPNCRTSNARTRHDDDRLTQI